jgi:predicted  nucleic acid-binding Zn-ribbon protein
MSAIAILRELHRLRRHIKGLQDEIDRAPRQIKAQLAKVSRQEEELKVVHDDVNKVKLTIRQNEAALKELQQQIGRWQQQMKEITSKKEYDALLHEIAGARMKSSELEDAILEGMTKADDEAARIPEQEKALKQAQIDVATFDQTSKERVTTLRRELEQTQGQVREVEEQLPPDFRMHYDRMVSAKGEDALSLVKDRSCQSCHTALTAQNFNDLRSGRLVTCKSCGRIVYLADEA